jgi:hypothetical protein
MSENGRFFTHVEALKAHSEGRGGPTPSDVRADYAAAWADELEGYLGGLPSYECPVVAAGASSVTIDAREVPGDPGTPLWNLNGWLTAWDAGGGLMAVRARRKEIRYSATGGVIVIPAPPWAESAHWGLRGLRDQPSPGPADAMYGLPQAPALRPQRGGWTGAVDMAADAPFSLIWGAPGTGKTEAAVELAARSSGGRGKILLCAPTDRALALLAKRAAARLKKKGRGAVLRFTGPGGGVDAGDPLCVDHYLLPQAEAAGLSSAYAGYMNGELRDRAAWGQVHEWRTKAAGALMERARVVAFTSAHAYGSLGRPRHVIVDDAGGLSEPETWAVARLAPAHVTLIGDHRQPGPEGLGRPGHPIAASAFERLYYRDGARAELWQQYRIRGAINEAMSATFYGGMVRALPGSYGEVRALHCWNQGGAAVAMAITYLWQAHGARNEDIGVITTDAALAAQVARYCPGVEAGPELRAKAHVVLVLGEDLLAQSPKHAAAAISRASHTLHLIGNTSAFPPHWGAVLRYAGH